MPSVSYFSFACAQRKVTKESGIPNAFGTNRSARKSSYTACNPDSAETAIADRVVINLVIFKVLVQTKLFTLHGSNVVRF